MKWFTVIGFYESDGITCLEQIEAEDPVSAMVKFVHGSTYGERETVAVIEGRHVNLLESERVVSAEDALDLE